MKFSLLALTGALLGSAFAAEQAVVKNGCKETIYVQSFPYDGSAPGKLVTLTTGQTYTENRRSTGSVRRPQAQLFRRAIPVDFLLTLLRVQTIKIDTSKTLSKPLFFGYSSTTSPNYAYCEFLFLSRGGLPLLTFDLPDEFSS
jgi:hypothetical protein